MRCTHNQLVTLEGKEERRWEGMRKTEKQKQEGLKLPVGMWLTVPSKEDPSDFQMALCYRGIVAKSLRLDWKGRLCEESFSSWGFFPRWGRGKLALPIDVKKARIFMYFSVKEVSGSMLVLEEARKEKARKYESTG